MKIIIFFILAFFNHSLYAADWGEWYGHQTATYFPDEGSCMSAQYSKWKVSYPSKASCTSLTDYHYHTLPLDTNQYHAIIHSNTGCLQDTTLECIALWVPDPPPPPCEQPSTHPCDFYDIYTMNDKHIQCVLGIEWSQEDCDFRHKDGCTTADGYSGPFGGYLGGGAGEADLGKMNCILGCNYIFDEYVPETGALHSSITIQSCLTSVPVPSENWVEEVIETDDVSWNPDNDLDTGTNCGEFNGEYLCIDSVDNGQCVTTPGGSYVCVSPPTVVPDTPAPIAPGVSIRIPGDDLNSPDDDKDVDLYPKPPVGSVPLCPSGSSYIGGKCVITPNPDGSCPPGYTKYGTQCVLDKDLGGPFSGPSGGLGGGLGGPPGFSYLDTLNTFYDKVRNSSLLDFSPNCGTGSSSCPSLTVLGTTTRIHCDLAEDAVPIFSAFLWLVGGLVAIRAVFSA